MWAHNLGVGRLRNSYFQTTQFSRDIKRIKIRCGIGRRQGLENGAV